MEGETILCYFVMRHFDGIWFTIFFRTIYLTKHQIFNPFSNFEEDASKVLKQLNDNDFLQCKYDNNLLTLTEFYDPPKKVFYNELKNNIKALNSVTVWISLKKT